MRPRGGGERGGRGGAKRKKKRERERVGVGHEGEEEVGEVGRKFSIGYRNVFHVQSGCHWKLRREKIRFIVSHSVVDILSICYLLADVSLITY